MKVLWIGDAMIQSGFSVVTHAICNELHRKCDLSVFGIGYNGRIRNTFNYYIFPGATIGDLYSFHYAADLIRKEDFDVVVVFNDANIVMEYIRVIDETRREKPFRASLIPMFPINLPPLDRKAILDISLHNIDYVLTYTEFSKREIEAINPNLIVKAIYHGVNRKLYFPNKEFKRIAGFKNNFVVGIVGTNTYRKRLDLFLQGFSKFASDKRDARCLVHATNKDIAFDLIDVANYFGIKDKLILSLEVLSEERINTLYNLMDVNVNTSLGEGFGLPLLEGASCGVPVLCASHGNLLDVWSGGANFIDIARQEFHSGFMGAIIDTNDMASKLNKLYEDRNYLVQQGVDALVRSRESLFNWEEVATKVYDVISAVNKGRVSEVG